MSTCPLLHAFETYHLAINTPGAAGYFGAARQRVKQLSKALNLQYSGELINGVTKVLVVADDLTRPPAELLAGQKVRTATSWGNVTVVSHQWLEDSAQRGVLCDPKHYTLLPQKASLFFKLAHWELQPLRAVCILAVKPRPTCGRKPVLRHHAVMSVGARMPKPYSHYRRRRQSYALGKSQNHRHRRQATWGMTLYMAHLLLQTLPRCSARLKHLPSLQCLRITLT